MAVTIERKPTRFLGNIVSLRSESYANARERIRLTKEGEFQRQVADTGMSTADQLVYRNKQKEMEQKNRIPDYGFIESISKEISSLKKLDRAEKYRDAYMESFNSYKAGKRNIQEHLDFLQSQYDNAIDSDIKDKIGPLISEAEGVKFTIETNILNNKVDFALNDKSSSLINDAIKMVNTRKSEMLASGREEDVTTLDLTLQNLKGKLQTMEIENAFNDFAVNNAMSPQTSVDYLKFYTDKLASADANTPIIIKDVRYNSAKDYWQATTNGYMNEKFFDLYSAELSNKLTVAGKQLNPVLDSQIKANNKEINDLMRNPNMINYSGKFEELKTNINFEGVDALSNKILSDYYNVLLGDTTDKNYANAIKSLQDLTRLYNVDLTSYVGEIKGDRAAKITALATSVAEVAARLELPTEEGGMGLTPDEAMAKANEKISTVDIPTPVLADLSPVEAAKIVSKSAGGDKSSPYETGAVNTPKPKPVSQPPLQHATLYGYGGAKKAVQVGSAEARDLQHRGWTLDEASSKGLKQATLVGTKGEKEVVYAGSNWSKELFGRGYKLMQ